MIIEKVTVEDAELLLDIYSPYVKDTAISFEYEVPSVEEFEKRIETISAKYPYIKAVDEHGEILGYAYAGAFKSRAAYDRSVETTVYVKKIKRRGGVGRALYEALEASLAEMGILNLNACIALPKEEEDPYLTKDSVFFHERMGFKEVGCFHECGYKFNRWYNMVWMEKMIGEHGSIPRDVKFGNWSIK